MSTCPSTMMNFVCQQCKEPLQLDTSLVDLAPSAYDMIVASLPPSPPDGDRFTTPAVPKSISQHGASSPSPHTTVRQPRRPTALPNESFVMLQDSVVHRIPAVPQPSPKTKRVPSTGSAKIKPPGKLEDAPSLSSTGGTKEGDNSEVETEPKQLAFSHHLRSTLRLFDILSTRTDIDHPLCDECTQILLAGLKRTLEETKKERDGYIAFEKEVKKEREREGGMSKEDAEKRIEKLKEEERIAVEQFKEAEKERAQLEAELEALEAEEKALEAEEAEFWRAYNDHLLTSEQQEAQLASLRAAYAADSAVLENLERTNVYNDAFCIGHDGAFGTINGLRLGRVPGVTVEWSEINAAWGQTLLLLYTIARKLGYTFDNYRLVPVGSFSRIERIGGDKATYELYGSGDLHLGRLLHNRRFDLAMVAFLDCLKQIIEFVKSQDAQAEFPHPIVKDKIGDVSIKLQFSQEDAWTRSLKHVLLALKILLKWATNGTNG